MLVKTKGLRGRQVRDGKDVLTTITGHHPGHVGRAILPSADTQRTFTVTYRLTDDNELRDASLTGPFYAGVADVTYTVELTTSDAP